MELLSEAGSLSAQQINFQFAPPPIASPYFQPGHKDFDLTGLYARQSGSGFNFVGGGSNFTYRTASNERSALDFQVGAMVLPGHIDMGIGFGQVNAVLYSLNLEADQEIQILKSEQG